MAIAQNPILQGFYPDPSVCAAGNDFYLVNSTFAYFPGVPIFKSSDLANWEQIGNVLDRNSQLPLEGAGHSRGIFAPTIRYNNGVFYMITTNIDKGNFYVTAEDPKGPWSEPYYLGEAANGIDPSLFFDDDGKCYYVGTHPNPEGETHNGDYYVYIQELDLENHCLVGEHKNVWNGALRDVIWPEGPHIYKRNGWYYIMTAEGGTGDDHCVSIGRSRTLFGKYINYPKNPILTHRHLGRNSEVYYVGHGDLVETKNGEWFMVLLAIRPKKGYTIMGRETFLAKVVWEDDWPIVNPGIGMLTKTLETGLPEEKHVFPKRCFHFYEDKLPYEMMMLRNADGSEMQIDNENGKLKLFMKAATLKDLKTPAFVCVRQTLHDYIAETAFKICSEEAADCAGIAVVQSNEYHVRFECTAADKTGKSKIRVIKCMDSRDEILAEKVIDGREHVLQIKSVDSFLSFVLVENGKETEVYTGLDSSFLSTEIAGGFVGCTIGMYASGNGCESKRYAEFSWLSVTD